MAMLLHHVNGDRHLFRFIYANQGLRHAGVDNRRGRAFNGTSVPFGEGPWLMF